MMTIVSPSATSSVKPLSTRFGPKALWTSTSRIIGRAAGGGGGRRTPTTTLGNMRENGRADSPARKEAGGESSLAARRPRPSSPALRRERPQCPTHVALAEPLERAIAQLAHALARHAQHRADLLEGVLATALESEVEPQHLRVTRRQRVQRLLDLVGEEAIHGLLLRVRHLVGHEALDERAITLRIHRRVEAHVARVERGERLHDVHRETGELRKLLGARLAVELLAQDLGRLDDARQVGGAVERHAHRPPLTRESGEDGLPDPPHGVGDELDALIRVELPRGREQ